MADNAIIGLEYLMLGIESDKRDMLLKEGISLCEYLEKLNIEELNPKVVEYKNTIKEAIANPEAVDSNCIHEIQGFFNNISAPLTHFALSSFNKKIRHQTRYTN